MTPYRPSEGNWEADTMSASQFFLFFPENASPEGGAGLPNASNRFQILPTTKLEAIGSVAMLTV